MRHVYVFRWILPTDEERISCPFHFPIPPDSRSANHPRIPHLTSLVRRFDSGQGTAIVILVGVISPEFVSMEAAWMPVTRVN
jgi:hypothetical protein